jgi:hypothetical protein
MNSYQYAEYTAKNDSFYVVKASTDLVHSLEVIQVYHEDAPSQAKSWPFKTNTAGLLYIFHCSFTMIKVL